MVLVIKWHRTWLNCFLVFIVFVELASDEIGYLPEEIFKQNTEGVALFLPNTYSKMWKERDKLKKRLHSKKEVELKDWGTSQPLHIATHEKACEENTKRVTEQPFDGDHGCDSQTYSGVSTEAKNRDAIIPVKTLPVWMTGNRKNMRWNKGQLSDFFSPVGLDHRAI